ncbi:dihydrofolate reductase [Kaustia mangrovi]|uniref:dihydrofolate reductase n=1 Tax=Kaustia mangrovi TaxID=2593653 RepID=UPI001FE279E1|nr:dihydrofolate reductase [Kaustia mangrovi]
MTRLVYVVAAGENGVIGRDGGLPWRLSSDLRRFKEITMGKPLVMGRKTYESIGRPLPGRDNIVVTRRGGFAPEGVIVADSLEAALKVAEEKARARGADEIAVIGGGEIFEALMDRVERIYLSRVHASPGGDVFLPALDPAEWRETAREDHEAGERDDASFSLVVLDRVAGRS